MNERLKLLVVGVGGQGVLTLAGLLGDAALDAGVGVVVGQLHGMSQRGGSVQSSVLFGPGSSSFIADGAADLVLGLEPLEAVRARAKMSSRTTVIVNRGQIVPYTLAQRGEEYPDVDGLLASLRAVTPHVIAVDGPSLVEAAGHARTLNMVMLGALAGLRVLPFDDAVLWAAVAKRCPSRYLEHNRRAYALGKEAA